MNEQNPYEQLGLSEDASFDQIQEAKKRLSEQYSGDQQVVESIEAAYDAILMDRLKMRQQGKIKVPEVIRFAERRSEPSPNLQPTPVSRSVSWLQGLIDTPSRSDVMLSSAVFLVLASVIAYPTLASTTLSLIIAFGVGFSVFFLNRKEGRLGRAVLLTLVGLCVGIGLGTPLASWLIAQVDSLSLVMNEEKIATWVTFITLWLISSFLH
ncbi:MAG TPA: CPP1-like family protein [Oculatellaceae cyanobacterium]|jgi:hypothetical protein